MAMNFDKHRRASRPALDELVSKHGLKDVMLAVLGICATAEIECTDAEENFTASKLVRLQSEIQRFVEADDVDVADKALKRVAKRVKS
jgi:hypothetical protein